MDFDEEQWDRFNRIAIRWVLIIAAVAGFLAVTSANGYSVGPGNGERTICEAAGGHMIDRVFVHRCEP